MPESGAIDQFTHDVPLPPGATVAGDWDQWDYECRILHGTQHDVIDDDVFVHSIAVQRPDGTFEHDDGHGGEAPSITVECSYWKNLTIEEARRLAAAITAVADELHGWLEWSVQR